MTLSALHSSVLPKRVSLVNVLLAAFLTASVATGCSRQEAPTSTPAATPVPSATRSGGATATLSTVSTTEPTRSPLASPRVDATAASPPTSVPAPTAAVPLVGSLATDFEFELFQGEDKLGGRELRLSDVTGQPLVLNFWARFCGPCWSEMPDLQDFYEEYGERVELLGIDVGQFTGLGSPKDAGKLLDALGVTYPAGYTNDAQVVRNYQVRAMPTTVFITAEGRVHRYWSGSIDREAVTEIVLEMLRGD